MLEAIGEHAHRERFDALRGFLARGPISEHAGEIGDLGEPTPVGFLLLLLREQHGRPRG